MTFCDSTTPIEELCQESHRGELWKSEGRLDELWVKCDQCDRELPGPPSPTQEQAAARALAAGWSLRRFPCEFPLPPVINMHDLLDGASCFCTRCSVEFATSP